MHMFFSFSFSTSLVSNYNYIISYLLAWVSNKNGEKSVVASRVQKSLFEVIH
jgi:hypothetical protein